MSINSDILAEFSGQMSFTVTDYHPEVIPDTPWKLYVMLDDMQTIGSKLDCFSGVVFRLGDYECEFTPSEVIAALERQRRLMEEGKDGRD